MKRVILELYALMREQEISASYLLNCDELSDKEMKKIISMKNSKHFNDILRLAVNKDIIKMDINTRKEMFSIIDKAKEGYQAKYASDAAEKIKVINSGKSPEIINIVSQAVGVEQAKYALYCLDKDFIYECENLESLLTIMCQSKYGFQALEVFYILREKHDIPEELLIKNCGVISQSVGFRNARCAREIACDKNVLTSDYALELIRIVSQAVGEVQAECSSRIARNKNVLSSGHAVELTKLASKSKWELYNKGYIPGVSWEVASNEFTNAKLIESVACNKVVLDSGHVVELAEKIFNTRVKEDAETLTEVVISCAKNNKVLKLTNVTDALRRKDYWN